MTSVTGDSAAWLEDASGNRIPIRGSCSLGRAAANQVSLPDERVSRRHAMIQAQQEPQTEQEHGYWLVDFGSRNGTYLNSQRITQPTRLRHGDAIRIGPFQLAFRHAVAGQDLTSGTEPSDQTVADQRTGKCWLLVADIIDSTQMVEKLQPDELARVTGQWLSDCKLTVEGCGGRINQFLGDGFFAFWHDHERVEVNVHKALEGLRRMQDQAQPVFRVVAHLGAVTIGGLAIGEEEGIRGREVHFVFRQEKLAKKLGEVRLLSESAWGRLAALVEAHDVGRHPLDGFEGLHGFYAF